MGIPYRKKNISIIPINATRVSITAPPKKYLFIPIIILVKKIVKNKNYYFYKKNPNFLAWSLEVLLSFILYFLLL